MTRLSIDAGPPVALPLAFFFAAPAWGIAAGLLLAIDGPTALLSRWSPAALGLVHAVTLGVLGNAMAGALLQFLPAAAGVRVRGGMRAGLLLFTMLNAGALALVAGFGTMSPTLLLAGTALSSAAIVLLAACTLPGLVSRLCEPLHRGITAAVVALLVTAALGVAMALTLTGATLHPMPVRWADVHAAWGLLGGVLMLLASVGQVVLPMFQALPPQPGRRHALWSVATYVALLALGVAVAFDRRMLAMPFVAACAAAWALSLLARQARAPLRRAGAMRLAWSCGAIAMLAAVLAWLLDAPAPAPVVGALVLALALPLPVFAMVLEIVAFLAWIELQRRTPRARRVPAVQALLPTRARAASLLVLGAGGAGVVAAAHSPVLAPVCGMAFAVAHAVVLLALLGVLHRSVRFLRVPAAP